MLPDPTDDNRKLREARSEIVVLQDAVSDLQRRMLKQAVLLRALFTLLSEREGPSEAELLDRFRRCDAEKTGAPVKKCSNCGRTVNTRHQRCMYCEEPCKVDSAFELLDVGAWPDLTRPSSTEHGITTKPSSEHGITLDRDELD